MFNDPNSFPEVNLTPLINAAKRWAEQYPDIICISLHHPLRYLTSKDKYIIVWTVPDLKKFYSLDFVLRSVSREYKNPKEIIPLEDENFFMDDFTSVYQNHKAPYQFRDEWRIELQDYRERVLHGVLEEGCWILYINKDSEQWSTVRRLKIEKIIREVKDEVIDLFRCMIVELKLQRQNELQPDSGKIKQTELYSLMYSDKSKIYQTAIATYDKQKNSNPNLYPHIKKDYLDFLERIVLRERNEQNQFLEKILCQIIKDAEITDITQKECREILRKINIEEKTPKVSDTNNQLPPNDHTPSP
jgi:hypothetical protein